MNIAQFLLQPALIETFSDYAQMWHDSGPSLYPLLLKLALVYVTFWLLVLHYTNIKLWGKK